MSIINEWKEGKKEGRKEKEEGNGEEGMEGGKEKKMMNRREGGRKIWHFVSRESYQDITQEILMLSGKFQ